jgi:hypothetical protein
MTDDFHPELAEYVPMDHGTSHGRRRTAIMRVLVLVGLAALILPGVLFTIAVASATASRTCAVYVRHYAPGSYGSVATFELFSPAGASWPGWQCYATDTGGDRTFVAPLGLIPSATVPIR